MDLLITRSFDNLTNTEYNVMMDKWNDYFKREYDYGHSKKFISLCHSSFWYVAAMIDDKRASLQTIAPPALVAVRSVSSSVEPSVVSSN